MNKKILFIALASFFCTALKAQKFGFVDANFIIKQMPAYQKAQKEIDDFSARAQKEVNARFDEVKQLELKYQAAEITLTDEMKRERKEEIEKKRQEAEDFSKKTFGFEGLLFLKKQELINPIREELNKAIEKMARKNALQVVYDKSGDFIVLYQDPRHDYTDKVLEELGLGDPENDPKKNSNR